MDHIAEQEGANLLSCLNHRIKMGLPQQNILDLDCSLQDCQKGCPLMEHLGFISAKCQKCHYEANITEFKVIIEDDTEVEEDFVWHKSRAEIQCPKCQNSVELTGR